MKRSRTRTAAVAVAVLALAGPAVMSASGAPAVLAEGEAPQPGITWTPCFEEVTEQTGAPYECGTVLVPLDYDRPERGKIEVEVTRIPASDPEAKRGSILLNPGGPGGSGIDFVLGFGPAAGFFLGPEIPRQFDLVGFDPRGVARSSPIRCFNTLDEAVQVFPPFPFPFDRTEIRIVRQGDRQLAKACRSKAEARRIGEHMSTANVARDMDEIRKLVGDDQLNFLGLSYGTFLGANYANLFPDKVGSVVVDGVLDPVAWVNLEKEIPFSTRLRSDKGAADTAAEFFVQCDAAAPGNCALAPSSEERFDTLMAALLEEDEPRMVVDPFTGETFPVDYRSVVGNMLGGLYNPFAFAEIALFLAAIEAAPPGGTASFAGASEFFEDVPQEPYPNFVESFPAVACVDTTNPRSYRVWERAGLEAEAEYGYWGRLWTWASSPCARWPFKDRDRFEGPFTAKTANPVLVIGNLYDPATRYEGAQTLRGLLPNSGLLTVDVPGHTSLGASLCAGAITGAYFLDPSVASDVDGFTCPPEYNAFDIVAGPPPPAPSEATEGSVETRRATTAPADVDSQTELRDLLDELTGVGR